MKVTTEIFGLEDISKKNLKRLSEYAKKVFGKNGLENGVSKIQEDSKLTQKEKQLIFFSLGYQVGMMKNMTEEVNSLYR